MYLCFFFQISNVWNQMLWNFDLLITFPWNQLRWEDLGDLALDAVAGWWYSCLLHNFPEAKPFTLSLQNSSCKETGLFPLSLIPSYFVTCFCQDNVQNWWWTCSKPKIQEVLHAASFSLKTCHSCHVEPAQTSLFVRKKYKEISLSRLIWASLDMVDLTYMRAQARYQGKLPKSQLTTQSTVGSCKASRTSAWHADLWVLKVVSESWVNFCILRLNVC